MFTESQGLYVAHSQNGPISIAGKMANRHGLIAGATGTGKTVTLQVLAETFSQAGVPCFMADMKGDLSGISQTGKMSGFIEKRCAEFGISNPVFEGCPTQFYDVFGKQGLPMRTTVSDMGPQLLSRLMGLNEVQSGVMDVVFKVADDQGLLILDLKDLRSMLGYVSGHAAEYRQQYGSVSPASVGAIQRAILSLESEGAEEFFGEPAFEVADLMRTEGGKSDLDKKYFLSKEVTEHGYTHTLVYQNIFDDIDASLEEFRCKIYKTKYVEPKREPISGKMVYFGEDEDEDKE